MIPQKILIISNSNNKECIDYSERLKKYLSEKGIAVSDESSSCVPDMAIVLGGDGSLLYGAKLPVLEGVPLLGINFGHLGYLTECEPKEGFDTIDRILEGKFRIIERVTLKCTLSGNDKCFNSMNDVVLHRGNSMHTISVNIMINNESTAKVVCDGIIVSTPTGSTAYNLSAGGPILLPTSDNIAITPICPRGGTFASFVTKGNDEIILTANDSAVLSVDGEKPIALPSFSCVKVTLSPKKVYTVKVSDEGFYSTLRRKLSLDK